MHVTNKVILAILAGIMVLLPLGFNNSTSWAEKQAQQQLPKKNEKACAICGMSIDEHKKTAVYIDYRDGTSEACCGVGCAIKMINQRGGYRVVRLARVTEWESKELIDMKNASYVNDSKLGTDMTTRIIAFKSEDAARKFIKENGGRLRAFFSLLKGTSYRERTR